MTCFTTAAICIGVGPYGGPTAVTIKAFAVYGVSLFSPLFRAEVKALDSDWLARAPPSAPPEARKPVVSTISVRRRRALLLHRTISIVPYDKYYTVR